MGRIRNKSEVPGMENEKGMDISELATDLVNSIFKYLFLRKAYSKV